MKIIKNFRNVSWRDWLLSFVAAILALIFLVLLNYFSFYIHEFGHASAAILSTLSRHDPTITINFTYINYIINFKVPQQTISILPRIMSIYGVIFTMIFYALIFIAIVFIISKIKRLKDNKIIAYSLFFTLILLVLRDIILNLFCGTDGLNLSCNKAIITGISWIFYGLLLISIGAFFLELFFPKSKNLKRRER